MDIHFDNIKLYHDALCTLDHRVSGAMVSPALMGSSGVIPLTIIAVVPEIMKHMANMIVRAEKEVYLATNYWINSVATKYITDAMKELSRRAGERGERIVFKMIYDRGSPKQLLEPHYKVSQKEYTSKAVAIPAPHEIPNLDLEVMNYHQPMLGTFHCKYMIVDRKQAVLQSNNIQDNDNCEMMIHLEGPIVDSLYDMALISWSKRLEPPLPSHNSPAAHGGLSTFSNETFSGMFQHTETGDGQNIPLDRRDLNEVKQPGVAQGSDADTGPDTTDSVLHPLNNTSTHPDAFVHTAQHDQQMRSGAPPTTQLGRKFAAMGLEPNQPQQAIAYQGDRTSQAQSEMITGTTSSGETGAQSHLMKSGDIPPHGHAGVDQKASNQGPDAKAAEYFESGVQAVPQSQIEKPCGGSNFLETFTADHPIYDIDIASEVARVQASVTPHNGQTRMQRVTQLLNHTKNPDFRGDAPECAKYEEMTPYIPHPVHEPFPIAMVCREPYGKPSHDSVYTPQNEVWLSALRNAEKNVFIQSPTLNAEPLVPAIIEACERGIDVYCYICLGYNDTGELLPKQGGTNEMIAHQLYTTLSDHGKKKLHWFWYIGKDQTRPIVAKKKKRSCHIKVMIVDEHIGIQGNGNQDTQSWYHSQEINVMFDSALVCRAWIDGLRRNQNTHLYGQVSQVCLSRLHVFRIKDANKLVKIDGIWRDENGKEPDDVIGVDPGRMSWAKGFVGAIKRVSGTGDF